ncbi:ADP-ribosylglycohydrolase family protein [uncultured Desulfovibrio sp.]|uniref:thioesterase, FlK family n=1 Tax=uncultured Desulfovibrio sp. TaxID=167968 RepID=UPI00265D0C23|nr:ADP-ribosylglycohydrolase family protein [uncultured Desulfovibrio sp.]
MLGAIIGDMVGSPYEFHPWRGAADAFPLFCPRSRFTDDTVMTVAVARGLMQAYGQEQACREALIDAMHEYGRAYSRAGYGQRFFRWIVTGSREPYNSFGNGSAMRVSPVGWVCDSLEDTERYAALSAAVTHDHPEGIKGACATAAAIFLARDGAGRDDIREYLSFRYGYDLDRSLAEIRPAYRHKESCQESVPEAIIAFLESRSFEEAVRNAVWLGGDSDTQAAIAGSMAEAFYGGVPQELREAALLRLDDRLRGDVAAWYAWLAEHRGIRLDRKAVPVQEQKISVSATGRDIMETMPKAGLAGQWETTVEEGMLAAQVGSGEVRVLATPMMIMGMERAAMEAVRPCLREGMTSVGTRVDISHTAPTPCGMKVRFEAKLTAVSANGRGLTFAVAAYDESGPIGEGIHERVVVDREKFQSRAQTRGGQG